MSVMQTVYQQANSDAFTQTNWDAQRAIVSELLYQISTAVGGGGGGGGSGLVLAPWTPANSAVDVSHYSPGGGFQNVLGGVTAFNSGTPDLFIFVFGNGKTYGTLAPGDVPDLAAWPIYGQSSASIPIPIGGAKLPGSGMLIVFSSTGNGYTAPASPNVGTFQLFVKPV